MAPQSDTCANKRAGTVSSHPGLRVAQREATFAGVPRLFPDELIHFRLKSVVYVVDKTI